MSHEYTTEIHKLLKLGEYDVAGPSYYVPENLPVSLTTPIYSLQPGASAAVFPSPGNIGINSGMLKGMLVYPMIFLVAFAFFYAVLNFPSLMAQVEGFFSKPQAQQILGDQSASYYNWIGNYFYAVGDAKLLEPANDLDKDGLSNFDEFAIRTNPIVADSDNDGFSDGTEIMNSTNPWGTGVMSKQQRDIVSKLDLAMVNNRISFNASTLNLGQVASAFAVNYDLEKPGRISIPKLNLQVPLVWSKDPANFENDLTKGVIHYPGTSMPGQDGISYISGHSSDYLWKRDPMANVFTKLNYLSKGDDIFVEVYGKDGKTYNFRYQVIGSNTYKPDDQAQFIENTGVGKLNLSTCWPIGTSKDRLVVSAVSVAL